MLSKLRQPSGVTERQEVLDGDVSEDEVTAALHRLHNEAAALSVPIRAFKMLALEAPYSLRGLAELLTSYLKGAPLPREVTTVTLHPILKPGKDPASKDNWRTIGFGTTVSRLLQTVVATRLKNYIELTKCLHRAQAGFLPKLSADMLCWLTTVILEDAVLAGSKQYSCFVDVKAAFASTGHADVAKGLLRVGITGKLATLIMSFLQQSSVYIVEDGHMCQAVHATVGLIEGCTFSPLLWDIVMDSLLCRLDTAVSGLVDAGLDVGPLMGDGNPLPATAYADDVRLIANSVVILQDLVDVTDEWMGGHDFELGVAPDKTAGLLNAAAAVCGHQLMVGDRELPLVEAYKYLGLLTSYKGTGDSARRHRTFALARVRSAVGMLRHSGIRQVRPSVGMVAYLTRIRPKLTYCLAVWGLAAPGSLTDFDRDDYLAQAVIMNADGPIPHAVINAVLCVPTLSCELDRGVIRLILRLVALPEDNMYRAQLAGLCRRWKDASRAEREHLKDTWWPRALARLRRLDEYANPEVTRVGCPYQPVGVKFAEAVETLLLEPEIKGPTGPPVRNFSPARFGSSGAEQPVPEAPSPAMGASRGPGGTLVEGEDFVHDRKGDWRPVLIQRLEQCMHYVTDWAAWCENQLVMDGMTSLTATRDLLCGRPCDGKLPFLFRDRSVHQTYLMHLPAGTHYLLGYAHHDSTCPWCKSCEVTVPHLLRDCKWWRVQRQEAVTRMRSAAIRQGLMSSDVPVECTSPEFVNLWYHLMVGRPVPRRVGPLAFVDALVFPSMEADAPRRIFRRPSVSPVDLQRYFAVLDGARQFVVEVLRRTQDVFGVVRRSTFGARIDPDVVNPLPPSGAVEDRMRELRQAQRRKDREDAMQ